METQSKSRLVRNLLSVCCVGLAVVLPPQGITGQETGQATVKAETLNVYVQMSTHSKVVKTLKQGDTVRVDMEIAGAGGTWCGVRELGQAATLGYVLCQDLAREPRQTFRILDQKLIGRWEMIRNPVNTDTAALGWLQVVVPGIHTVISFRADGTFNAIRSVFGGDQPSGEWEEVVGGTYTFVDTNHLEMWDREAGGTIAEVLRLTQKELRLRLGGKTMTLTRVLEETSPSADRTPATRPDEDKSRGQATVTVEDSTVHSHASASSKTVKTLKKGEVVSVDFEIVGAGGTWCSIKEADAARALGYVLCKDLERGAISPGRLAPVTPIERTASQSLPALSGAGVPPGEQGASKGPERRPSDLAAEARAAEGEGTALIRAVRQGDMAAVKALLEAGADVNERSVAVPSSMFKGYDGKQLLAGGYTPLILAARQGHLEIVRLLLAKGAEVNAKDGAGRTAFIYAGVNLPVIQLLLAAGADRNVRDPTQPPGLSLEDRANKSWIIGALGTLNGALYGIVQKTGSYPKDLAALVPEDPNGAGFIFESMRRYESGYNILYRPGRPNARGEIQSYTVLARPKAFGLTGRFNFFTEKGGMIRVTNQDREAGPSDPYCLERSCGEESHK